MHFIICFIDDSPFEHELLQREIAPFGKQIRFLQTFSFDEARENLGSELPVLFLLDLWGQDPDVPTLHFPPQGALEEKIARFKTLDDVYRDLEVFKGDRANEFLKRLFSIVDSWRALFEETSDGIGQNRNYGLSNLRRVRERYPGIPAVFYTRKSLINDAVAMFHAGADGLFIKPTGRDDEETKTLTRAYAPKLLEEIFSLIDLHLPRAARLREFYSRRRPKPEVAIQDLLAQWNEYRAGR